MEPVAGGKYKCAKCGCAYDPGKGDPEQGLKIFRRTGNAHAATKARICSDPSDFGKEMKTL